ncbi:hypothetical protein [Paenibacillus sp. MCAF9]
MKLTVKQWIEQNKQRREAEIMEVMGKIEDLKAQIANAGANNQPEDAGK